MSHVTGVYPSTSFKRLFHVTLGKMLQPEAKCDDDVLMPYVRASNIKWSGLELDDLKEMWFSKRDLKTYTLSPGDLLVIEGGDVGRACVVDAELGTVGFQNSVHRVRPQQGSHIRFAYYWMAHIKNSGYLNLVCSKATLSHFTFEKFLEMPFPVMRGEEQSIIACFLDRETGLIDGLIEKKTRFIALLKEKRAAVITHAVTKGIDPNAPMKDSGQDWIGKVPEHWDVIAAARLFDERDERSKTGDEELLTVSHITGVTPRSEKTVHMIEAESTIGYKRCLPGDLVINTLWAWMGAMGTARILGISSPAYNVYTPRRHLIDPRYIDYLVRMPVFAKEVTRFSKGVWSSRLRLYPEGLREVRFPVPPLAEQAQLADHLDQQTTKIDGLITLTERSIDLLREKRAALITAAVTGKIDVRAAA